MSQGLAKLIALLKRTGDRCVVLDAQGNPAFVLLSLEQYDELLGKSHRPAESNEDFFPVASPEKTQNLAENPENPDAYEFEPIE